MRLILVSHNPTQSHSFPTSKEWQIFTTNTHHAQGKKSSPQSLFVRPSSLCLDYVWLITSFNEFGSFFFCFFISHWSGTNCAATKRKKLDKSFSRNDKKMRNVKRNLFHFLHFIILSYVYSDVLWFFRLPPMLNAGNFRFCFRSVIKWHTTNSHAFFATQTSPLFRASFFAFGEVHFFFVYRSFIPFCFRCFTWPSC